LGVEALEGWRRDLLLLILKVFATTGEGGKRKERGVEREGGRERKINIANLPILATRTLKTVEPH
jgi:hypothetical protein